MLFSVQDERTIEATIAEVEARTAGEIVVAVARRSEDYGLWRSLPTVGLALLGTLGLHEAFLELAVPWLLLAQLTLIIAIWFVLGWGPLLRRLVPDRVAEAAVSARAKQIFLERGLTETRDRSGVLLFLSELEHRVELLADKGIHDRVGVQAWQSEVALVGAAIRGGKASEGLCNAIRRIGQQLADAFPPRAADTNEMPNSIVRVD